MDFDVYTKYQGDPSHVDVIAQQRIRECVRTNNPRLDLSNLLLRQLPDNLPKHITSFYCSNNLLTHLPDVLPEHIEHFWCFSNKLMKLPTLPKSLKFLICNDNKLTELPEDMPDSLIVLICSNNNLTHLPKYMPASLDTVFCAENEYLHIDKQTATRYKLTETPNYNEHARTIQCIWRARHRMRRLRFCAILQQHIDEFRYRPNNSGYIESKISFNKTLKSE
jgi:Leucine-rich repeat (LRR) protein